MVAAILNLKKCTRGIFGASSEFVWGDVNVSFLKKSAFCNFIPGSTLMLLHYFEKLQHCAMALSAWMTGSKLNSSKTDFRLIGTKLQREKNIVQDTNSSASATNLGVVFDSCLNFQKHISQTCRKCFYYISDLRRIRKSLSSDLAQQIAVVLVRSKLDYCNSLFFTIYQKRISLDYNAFRTALQEW